MWKKSAAEFRKTWDNKSGSWNVKKPGNGSGSGSSKEGDEQMRYGMLGDDLSNDLEKLEKYTGEVDWGYLKKHYEAGSIMYVDPSLDLLAVGKAFADDNKESVQAWKKSGDLIQPSEPHAEYWEQSKAKFLALVVSPFVLIQPIPAER